jgi:DNA-binding transcriptional LysR family regulator
MKNFDFETAGKLRILDFDDMLMLALLHDGMSATNCAKVLCLSQPAVSQRMKKISESLDFAVFRPEGRRSGLTLEGRVMASACKVAIKIITDAVPK